MATGITVFELKTMELMVLVRRLRLARRHGGLGPTETELLTRFELELPPNLRGLDVVPTEELPSVQLSLEI